MFQVSPLQSLILKCHLLQFLFGALWVNFLQLVAFIIVFLAFILFVNDRVTVMDMFCFDYL